MIATANNANLSLRNLNQASSRGDLPMIASAAETIVPSSVAESIVVLIMPLRANDIEQYEQTHRGQGLRRPPGHHQCLSVASVQQY